MDKCVELFCEQNPTMNLPCQNPACDYEETVDSKTVFQDKEYKFYCPACGSTTTYDTSKFGPDFQRQLEEAGIRVE